MGTKVQQQGGKHHEEENGGVVVGTGGGLASRCGFGWLAFVAELLLAGSLALVLFWVFHYHGGVALVDDGSKQMNLHYVLMVAGFAFFNGHGLLVYRVFPCCKRIYSKALHAVLFLLAGACVAVGMFAAIDAHSEGPNPVHFYSMHSWIGLVACGLFALQFLVGFVTFLVLLCCDQATAQFRGAVLPVHVTMGLATFVIATAASLTGLTQSARYRLSGKDGKPNYKDFPEQGIILNVLAMCLIALCIVLPFVIRNSSRRRYATLTIN